MKQLYIGRLATAYLKRRWGESLLVKVVPLTESDEVCIYDLFCEDSFAGRILFDEQGYWIYDGQELSVEESEHLAAFILRASKPELTY